MAAVTTTEKPGNTYLHTWTLTTADPNGDSITIPGARDKTVQIGKNGDAFGTATLVVEGSNVAVPAANGDWFTLHDGDGQALSFTAAGGEVIAENPLHLRVRLSAVGVGASIFVGILSGSTMR